MIPASTLAIPTRADDAPQPVLPTGFKAKAAAHLSLLYACGVGVLIAATAVCVCEIGSFVLRPASLEFGVSKPPAVSNGLAYHGAMQPEAFVVCGVETGVCNMRTILADTSWRLPPPMKAGTPVPPYEMRQYFRKRMAMRIMPAEEIEANRQEQLRLQQEQFRSMPALTDAQTVALLKMTNPRNYGSTFCRGIASYIQRQRNAWPTYADYAALKDIGLSQTAEGSPWHVFTIEGARTAPIIAKMKAQELDIHMFMEGSKVKATASFSCTCGQWGGTFSRGPNGSKNAYSHWNAHVAALAPGKQGDG